ncbi:MAG TPA: hypothetical protein VLJ44_00265 [Gaiellaceae bacterium]|nr:hypothetical protein [Gaiellaceae bacterium]
MHAANPRRPRLVPTMWFLLILLLIATSWSLIAMLIEYLIDRAS